MRVRLLAGVAAALAMPLCAWPGPDSDCGEVQPAERLASSAASAVPDGIIRKIEFAGLRRIPAAALRVHIGSRVGRPLDPAQVEDDVRALDRLGWFDSVTAEVHLMPVLLSAAQTDARWSASLLPANEIEEAGLRLVFVVEERPFLAAVEFRGSHVLSRGRINTVLGEKQIALRVAAPASRTELWRARRAIEGALADLGHPSARVRLRLDEVPTAAVRAVFEISDGPAISVSRVSFAGNHAFSERTLRRQMKRIAPGAHLAELRHKNTYTRERLTEDVERLENFYRNHGYPEARMGQPIAEVAADHVLHWSPFTVRPFRVNPWPRRRTAPRLHISIPVEEGRFYRLGAVELRNELADQRAGESTEGLAPLRALQGNAPYSQEKLESARESLAGLRVFQVAKGGGAPPEVEVSLQLDPEARTARAVFRLRKGQPYIVRRIEFVGFERFSDRYYRRRVQLKEGELLNTAKLESSLARLAHAGFIRPVKREDIRLKLDEQRRTVDVTIRIVEVGRQRVSLVGGHGGLGGTLGLVYNVLDLFGGEELITAHLEGGPDSLQVLLGVAKEGVFGTRASLGLSVFQNVVRPNLPGASGRQRLFTSRSSGFALGSSYQLTPLDAVGLNYQLSRSSTQYHLDLPSSVSGLVNNRLRAATSSRSVGLNAEHDSGSERLAAATSVSGGWLGGNESLLRSSLEYSRLLPDPLGRGQGSAAGRTWAFRGYLAGVSSYRGELPLQARLFPGDELVRGFRTGELGPYALVKTAPAGGTSRFKVESPGADLVGAINGEYRVPVTSRTEAAGFFDLGSGWLLPGWLGPSRPTLLQRSNGALHGSTGIEMRWRVPGLEQPLRFYYAFNPFRPRHNLPLPDGSRFRFPDRRTALGWAFASLF